MAFNPSIAPVYVKALVVALLSCSAMNVVVADLISEGGMRSSPASNISVLTSNATPTTRDAVNKLETRILRLSSSIDEIRLAIEEIERTEVMGHRQKYSDDRFTDLELEKIEGKQLSANVHKLREWFDSVVEAHSGYSKEASRAALNTLSLHHEEKTVVMALLSATYADKQTKSMAHHMIKAQFQKWIEDGKTAGDVFALLDLDKLARDLLRSPSFVLWACFVRAASPNSEAAKRAMFTFLSGHYNDDAAFSDALLAGSKIKNVKTIAFELELAQVERWTNEHKTSQDVFESLKLDKAKGQLFENPLISKLFEYVVSINQDPATIYETMYMTLKPHYSDYDLAKVLVAEPRPGDWYNIAPELRKIQLSKWLDAGKSEKDVFELFKLHLAKGQLFEDPLINTWFEFVAIIQDDLPAIYETIYMILKPHYSDYDLAKLLVEGPHTADWHTIAPELEELQLLRWKDAGKSEKDVFELLELHLAKGQLFEDQLINTWFEFVAIIQEDPPAIFEMIYMIVKPHYSDYDLAKLLVERPHIADRYDIASELEELQLLKWKNDGKSEKDVFELLKLHLAEGQLFEDELINTWFGFVAIFHEDLPAIFEMIYTIVKPHYSDYDLAKLLVEGPHTADRYDIAPELRKVQLSKWKDAGKSEKDVSKLMKLQETGVLHISENPTESAVDVGIFHFDKGKETRDAVEGEEESLPQKKKPRTSSG